MIFTPVHDDWKFEQVRWDDSIFLAGPSLRNNQKKFTPWRSEAVEFFRKYVNFGKTDLLVPESFIENYEDQVEWETHCLRRSAVIMFWIPRNLETLPGFTTNIEFGQYLESGKIVLGYPQDAPKMRYLHNRAERNDVPIEHTLEKTVLAAIRRMKV